MPIAGPTIDHDEIRMWALERGAVPLEILPQMVDHETAMLRIMLPEQARGKSDLRVIGWDEFFLKFDALALSFVYDDASSGYNELLQGDAAVTGGRSEKPTGLMDA